MDAIWAKSVALFDLFAALVEERCAGHGLECISPTDPEKRGSHISYRHPHAFEICPALIEAAVIGDFRDPDVLRFGRTQPSTGWEEYRTAVYTLVEILEG